VNDLRRDIPVACTGSRRTRFVLVPEISRFFGIVVAMYYDDHPPPHFHVRYGGHKAILEIETGTVLFGDLPPRALGMVVEWAAAHREELEEDWTRAGMHAPLLPIRPLE